MQVLKQAQEKYGIDGFKFDAGDNNCYASTPMKAFDAAAATVDHTSSWAKIGLSFPFNEYRACWKMGGQPLVQRLGDKDYSWDAVRQLIPQMCVAGLMGYAYACPDMIGGGQWAAFLNIKDDEFDQALIVRSAQVHALMPMMQFSASPWRVLDKEHQAAVKDAVALRQRFAPRFVKLAEECAKTGEPMLRNLEYNYPGRGYAKIKDQFMMGDFLLVAPQTEKGGKARKVVVPPGSWRGDDGAVVEGPVEITVQTPLSRLVYFTKE